MQWGIVLLVGVVVFICWQMARHRTTDTESLANGAVFELVSIGYDRQHLPERFRLIRHYGDEIRKGRRDLSMLISVVGHEELHNLRLGEDIPDTEFKVASFKRVFEQRHDALTVTIVNKETGAEEVLPLRGVFYSGDARAYFRSKAVQPGGQALPEFSARIGETFTFPPESGKAYRVLDIKGRGAVIERPDGTKMLLTALR